MSDVSGSAGGNGALEGKFRDAMAHLQGGEVDKALGLFEDILKDKPDHADALHVLGLVAHQQGRGEDAKRLIADAIGADGSNALFHNNLGEVKRMLGEAESATASYRAAIALQPGYAQAHNNLGLVLFQLDKADEAVEELTTALSIDPNAEGVHNNLGVMLEAMDRLDEAILCFRRSLELAPNQAEVNNNLGAALHTRGEYQEAEQYLRTAARIDPNVANVPYNLSRLYLAQGRLDEAMSAAREAITLNPRHPDYYIALGAVQRAMGDLAESLKSLRTAVAIDADHPMALNDLGVCLLTMGQFDEAESKLRRALDAEPRLAVAHENLARARRFSEDDRKQIEFVEALASAPNQTEESYTHLHFALGKMLDDIGEYERAFRHFQTANEFVNKQMEFDADAVGAFVDRSRALFDSNFVDKLSAFGNPSDTPVFIVGMLRSGTTLLEQILASHPLVFGAGEREYFRALARQLPGRIGSAEPYPECLKSLDPDTARSATSGYLEQIAGDLQDATRFTDKNPLNFEHLGLIMTLFPNARVIHCRRQPMDLCLSIYFQHFSEHLDFAYSFADIANYHRQYLRLMDHWLGLFPERILEVQYETLVASLESESRKVFAHLSLEWDENCLAFHRTARPVGTASHWQVRQPLYTRSVERWRHYEPYLEKLRAALAERPA